MPKPRTKKTNRQRSLENYIRHLEFKAKTATPDQATKLTKQIATVKTEIAELLKQNKAKK